METKIKTYETLVIYVLMYGEECWTTSHEDERRLGLLAAEIGWLWRIAGISRRERKRNKNIRKLLDNRETIIQKIQTQRLRLFGHMSRIDVSRLLLQASSTKVSGYRSKERPSKRWIDCIRCHTSRRTCSWQWRRQEIGSN